MPEPVREPDTVIQELVVVAVHVQVDCVVTVMVPDAPVAGALIPDGENENVQEGPDCVTLNDFPPTVTVADLGRLLVFAATLKVTVPDPVPLVPAEIVTHDALLDAVQLQVEDVVRVIVPVPPVVGNA